MAEIKYSSGLVAEKAKVVDRLDERDNLEDVNAEGKPRDDLDDLKNWILTRIKQWRDYRRQNYEPEWDQYERTWRGMWAAADKNRNSEKSTLVTPATAEAVENIVAEVEEALFGRGDFFDIKAEISDEEILKAITDRNKANFKDDLSNSDFVPNVGEALINSAVYGSGIGEIFVDTFIKRDIVLAVEAVLNAGPAQPGVEQAPVPEMEIQAKEVHFSYLQSVNPRNFLIEPTARTVDKALGVAIEEYVGSHIIGQGQKSGKYREVDVGTSAGDQELGADRQRENEYVHDKVHIIRYYGLVPAHMLPKKKDAADVGEGEEIVELFEAKEGEEKPADAPKEPKARAESGKKSEDPLEADMVEAQVFIANENVVIKAGESPYVMKDRPVVAFPWDIVPGRFWGRGVCEKGIVPQKVLDAELRSRVDALAFTNAPMMAMDASRLPRGFQLKVRPGKSILTNGDPKNILNPMHFGQLDATTFQHSQQLDQMIQRATGSLDVIALATRGGDVRPGAVSMMLSGIVKRHKRTLMNFVERFFVPALRKMMWRNMQFNPERYTPVNFTFVASSTMGILQREYENQILVQLLQTMEPQSKEYKIILMGVISNTGLTHRQQLIKMLEASIQTAQQLEQAQMQAQTDPQTQALQGQLTQVAMQLQIATGQAKIRELNSRAQLQDAKTQNEMREPLYKSMEIATKGIYEVEQNRQSQEFDRRMAVADRLIKIRDIDSNERIARIQSGGNVASEAVKAHGTAATKVAEGQAAVATEQARGAATVASEHAKVAGNVIGEHVKGVHSVIGEHVAGVHGVMGEHVAGLHAQKVAAAKPKPMPARPRARVTE